MRRSLRAFTLIEIMIVITIIAILAAIMVPSFKRARSKSQLSACASNCKNTATALEMYAVDNAGRFPSLSGLAGIDVLIAENFLKRRPSCPTTSGCTFVDYTTQSTPDSYSFSCVGNNHGDLFPGFTGNNIPSYTSGLGVIDHP
ncbi:prepilin-type N-terminal cleavage/methylation domain-containing protein [bacterium]|nr:prepilin-type N-terminal cleavage/methylation domain-containing protein [bacterium]